MPESSFSVINPYNTSKIYALKSHHEPRFYIGSTTLPLVKRLIAHKSSYNKFCKGTAFLYSTAYEIVKHTDVYIELLEECNVDTNIELRLKEKEHYLKHKDNIVNKNVPYTSKEEKKKQMDWHNKNRKNEKKKCEFCGVEVLKYNFKLHEASQKHIQNFCFIKHPELQSTVSISISL